MTDWLLPFPSLRGEQLMRVFVATAQTDQSLSGGSITRDKISENSFLKDEPDFFPTNLSRIANKKKISDNFPLFIAMELVAPTDIENVIQVTEQGRVWYAHWSGGDEDGARADFRARLLNLPFAAAGAATPDQLNVLLIGADSEQIEAAISLMTAFNLFVTSSTEETLESDEQSDAPPADQEPDIEDMDQGGESVEEEMQHQDQPNEVETESDVSELKSQPQDDPFEEQKTSQDREISQALAEPIAAPSSGFRPDVFNFDPGAVVADTSEEDPYASPFSRGAKGLFGNLARARPQPASDEPPNLAKTSETKAPAAEPQSVDSGLPAPGTSSGGTPPPRVPKPPVSPVQSAPGMDGQERRGPRSGWLAKRSTESNTPQPVENPQASNEPRFRGQTRQESPSEDTGNPLDKFRRVPKEQDMTNSGGMTRRTQGANDLRPVGPRSQKSSGTTTQPTDSSLPTILSFTYPDGFKVEISRELYNQYVERHQGDIDAALLALRDLFEHDQHEE